jgi:hypothetical protein
MGGTGAYPNRTKQRNYSPPQGHAGDMNSCHQKYLIPTGLFSLIPTGSHGTRNKVIESQGCRVGRDIPVLTNCRKSACDRRSVEASHIQWRDGVNWLYSIMLFPERINPHVEKHPADHALAPGAWELSKTNGKNGAMSTSTHRMCGS